MMGSSSGAFALTNIDMNPSKDIAVVGYTEDSSLSAGASTASPDAVIIAI